MKPRRFKLKTLSKGRLSVHGHLLKDLLINELQLYNNTAICLLENYLWQRKRNYSNAAI